jgi:hypothetical protein
MRYRCPSCGQRESFRIRTLTEYVFNPETGEVAIDRKGILTEENLQDDMTTICEADGCGIDGLLAEFMVDPT